MIADFFRQEKNRDISAGPHNWEAEEIRGNNVTKFQSREAGRQIAYRERIPTCRDYCDLSSS
jgi:hypothetical protein